MLQSIGYANLAGLDPEYGLCKSKTLIEICILPYIFAANIIKII